MSLIKSLAVISTVAIGGFTLAGCAPAGPNYGYGYYGPSAAVYPSYGYGYGYGGYYTGYRPAYRSYGVYGRSYGGWRGGGWRGGGGWHGGGGWAGRGAAMPSRGAFTGRPLGHR
ncbi:hypothetical protein [Methylocella sp. CPCC 101449]|uniref:hypothetical protein n=1 Tax=Methylocella sp. CPCC 101449 TaxID=2987531 RepID=UPI00288F2C32|nr:hypothetical protein [Methylocella sp. CPCC 101449]MDT2022806.1 hypothetical protein [Methylocella sp. CPCC 101449]